MSTVNSFSNDAISASTPFSNYARPTYTLQGLASRNLSETQTLRKVKIWSYTIQGLASRDLKANETVESKSKSGHNTWEGLASRNLSATQTMNSKLHEQLDMVMRETNKQRDRQDEDVPVPKKKLC
jgi:hypothetical protein